MLCGIKCTSTCTRASTVFKEILSIIIIIFLSDTYAKVAKRTRQTDSSKFSQNLSSNYAKSPNFDKSPSPPDYSTIAQYTTIPLDQLDSKAPETTPRSAQKPGTMAQNAQKRGKMPQSLISTSSGYATGSGLTSHDASVASDPLISRGAPPVLSAGSKTRTGSNIRTIDPQSVEKGFEIGTMVEVADNPPNCRYGVIRWMGFVKEGQKEPLVGLEMVSYGIIYCIRSCNPTPPPP